MECPKIQIKEMDDKIDYYWNISNKSNSPYTFPVEPSRAFIYLFILFIYLFNSLFWVDNIHLVPDYTNPNRQN